MRSVDSARPSLAGRLVLVAWAAITLALGVALLATHLPLPLPELQRLDGTGRWTLLHALAPSCPCSRRVLDHLKARGAQTGSEERILLVDGDEAERGVLTAKGFRVELLGEQELARRFGISAVPSLVIVRPDGSIAYRGAHQERPQMPPSDLALLARAQAGAQLQPLPILGCAVSSALRKRLDPIGLKYPTQR